MQQKSYLKNAAILTATGLGLRAVGMFFRIYIAARVGAEGMGLHQLISTVYALAITLATAGLSVAATRICADQLAQGKPAGARRAMGALLTLALALSLGAGLLLFFGAPLVATLWLKDARAIPALCILAPSLPFIAWSAVLRGYFMARRAVGPNSCAQIFEQIIRIGLVAFLLDAAAAQSIQAACMAIVLGNTVSEAASWVYMAVCYQRDVRAVPRQRAPVPGLRRELWVLLAPLFANQTLTSLLRTVENVMVPTCLAVYTQNRELALSQYGALKGMALPVLFFPFSFLGTLSTLLLPEITEACVQGRRQTLLRLIQRVMLLTMAPSILAGGVFYTFANEIGTVLYQSAEIGFYLAVLGPLAPFMYLESIVDGVLKGLNEQFSTFRYAAVDSCLRIALIWLLLPRFGMKGFLFVMLVSNLLTSLLNLQRMLHITGLRFQWMQWLAKPLLCLALSQVFCRFVLAPLLQPRLPTLGWALAGCAGMSGFYLLLLWLTGGARPADLWHAAHRASLT